MRAASQWLLASVLIAASTGAGAAVEFSAALGQRYEELSWTIADLDGEPNILSELAWTDLRANTLGATLLLREDEFFLSATYTTGVVVAGKNRDSDYGANDRQCEMSRSENSADDGSVREFQLQLGFETGGPFAASVVAPFVMYLQRALNLTITDGHQTISNVACVPPDQDGFVPPVVGPIAGLNSSYDSEWSGFAFGANAHIDLPHRLRAAVSLMHAFVDYSGKANWNLREDFSHPVSFRHNAEGDGDELALAVEYRLESGTLLFARATRYVWSADAGTSTYFFANGFRTSTRLNGVDWDGYSVTFGVTGSF